MQSVRMAAIAAAVVLVGSVSAPAFAAPSPGATGVATPVTAATPLPTPVPPPVAPSTVCTISGNSAVQITGLVATADGYVVVDGKNNSWGNRVAYLNKTCGRIGSAQSYPNGAAVDPQDIAVDSKGTLWIADTGDQPVTPQRQTVALFKVTSKSAMTRYRFSYPDGSHNTQALLLNGNGAPIFVTKAISGPATIFTYTGTLTSKIMQLSKAGEFTPEQTGTANKLGNRGPAQNEITGGANSPDGKKVALRTLTDAYEWDVTNGDVLAALTKGKPRITPMPNEDQGYAIAYTTDSKSFLTVSDSSASTPILKYKPAAPLSAAAAKKAAAAAAGPGKPSAIRAWFNKLTFSQLMWLLAGVAAVGFVLLLIGVLGIRRARKGFAAEAAKASESGADAGDGGRLPAAVGGAGVYGAPRGSDPYAAPSAPPAPPGPAGGVYGGGQYPGGQYSGGQYPGGSTSGGPAPGRPSSGGPPPGGPSPNGQNGRGGGVYGGGQYGGGQYGAPADPYGDEGPGHPGSRRGTSYGDGQYRG